MMSEILAAVLRANLVAAAVVLAVLALRIPFRRLFGPELAYGLWAAPPLAVSVSKLPPVALVMLAVTVVVPWS